MSLGSTVGAIISSIALLAEIPLVVAGGLLAIWADWALLSGIGQVWITVGTRDRFDAANQLHQIEKQIKIYEHSTYAPEHLLWEGSTTWEQYFMDVFLILSHN